MNDAETTVDPNDHPPVEPQENGAPHSMRRIITRRATQVATGLAVTAPFISALRKLHVGDALAWMGLSRQRSPLVTVGIFGAGMATGATMALFLAPTSGLELRGKLADWLMSNRAQADGDAEEGEATDPKSEPTTKGNHGGNQKPAAGQPGKKAANRDSTRSS